MSTWAELNRRGVTKACLAYLAFAWLIVQVAATVVPAFDGPVWLVRAAVVAFVIGTELDLPTESCCIEFSFFGARL